MNCVTSTLFSHKLCGSCKKSYFCPVFVSTLHIIIEGKEASSETTTKFKAPIGIMSRSYILILHPLSGFLLFSINRDFFLP